MQNVLAAVFEIESEGYQAITTLRQNPVADNYAILQMALIKRVGKTVSVCDSFNSGISTNDDSLRGGLVGSMLGILGGPIGVLLMGSAGALTGSLVDTSDAISGASLVETVANKMVDGTVALVAVVEEDSEAALDAKLGKFKAEILRFDAAVIAEEVEEAERLQKEMERQARAQLRATKKEEYKKSIEEKRTKLAADFEAFKARFKKA